MDCLAEIRDVLKKHGKLDRFGINLLHKHFDMADDEILMETIDEEGRRQILQPMKQDQIDKLPGEVLETSWSLQEGAVMVKCKRSCVTVDGKHYPNQHVWG